MSRNETKLLSILYFDAGNNVFIETILYNVFCIMYFNTLKVLNFTISVVFHHFREICTRKKFQNFKMAKSNTRKIKYLPSLRFSFP